MSAGTTVFEPTQPAINEPVTNAPFSGIVPFLVMANSEFDASLRKISDLADLPANWDTYGSPRVQPPAIRQASELLVASRMICSLVPRIVPVAGGGIQVEWQYEDRELEIEVLPDGSMGTLMVMGKEMREARLPADRKFAYVKKLLDWLVGEYPYATATG